MQRRDEHAHERGWRYDRDRARVDWDIDDVAAATGRFIEPGERKPRRPPVAG
ncbi:MAG: hypothetical protein JWO86_8997 [Myxococcaceae bacterium]|nr:hypothetical protein [Myxococcaceae bacterium]